MYRFKGRSSYNVPVIKTAGTSLKSVLNPQYAIPNLTRLKSRFGPN